MWKGNINRLYYEDKGHDCFTAMEEVTSSRKSRQSSLKGKVDNSRKDILNPKNVLMPIKNISNSLSPNSSIEKLKSPWFKATYFEQKRVISKIPRVVQRLQEMQAIHQHMV